MTQTKTNGESNYTRIMLSIKNQSNFRLPGPCIEMKTVLPKRLLNILDF